jgi:surfactin synthase thioesterase subunit
MITAYCIPGMGVDGRLFKNIRLEGCELHHINWKSIGEHESLPEYAMRLAEVIDTSKPFILIGVSMGGMCSVEIAKRLKPLRTFVISSCVVHKQLPTKLTFWRHFALYRLLDDKRFIAGAMLTRKQFGIDTPELSARFYEMLKSAPRNYFKRAVRCLLTWRNTTVPGGVIHIHGTNDKILPYKNIGKCDHTIEGGNHFMIVSNADEINRIINRELKKIEEK